MKIFRNGKPRLFLIAGMILAVCAGVFIVSAQIVQGTQEGAFVSQQSTYDASKKADELQESAQIGDNASPEPSETQPVFIAQADAIGAAKWVAANIFNLAVDNTAPTATFEADHDLLDENGVAYSHIYANWQVQSDDYECLIDAITGDVLTFKMRTDDYPGESITEGDFSNFAYDDLCNDPSNIYVTTARTIVEAHLSEGREIESIQIDGVQFIWNENTTEPDPDATGTIQVDCHVYMESGRYYTLSFWGTDEIVLKTFSTYPSKQACQWGYFYEDQPPISDGWKTAPGITQGE